MRITEPYTIFPRKLSSGKTVYYYQFRDSYGRRSSAKSTGCSTLSQAKRYCKELYNNNEFGTNGSLTFKNFAEGFFSEGSEYLKWQEINKHPLKPETVRKYVSLLKYQIMPFFEKMQMTKINASTIKEWIIWASESWSAKTINNAQGTLNIIFENALEKEIILKNPLHNISYRKIEKKKRSLLTVEEVKMLYHSSWASEIHQKVFLLSVITGMRIGEITALRKDDIHESFIDVTHSYSSKYGLGATKTYLNRYVPIPSDFPFPPSTTEWIFDGCNDGKPILSHAVYNNFCRILERKGIDKKERGLTIHSLRNFFISYLQSKNVTEAKIRAVVGHADETMTDLYTYWKPEMFPEVYKVQKELFDFITKE